MTDLQHHPVSRSRFSVLQKLRPARRGKLPNVARPIYVLLVVCVAWCGVWLTRDVAIDSPMAIDPPAPQASCGSVLESQPPPWEGVDLALTADGLARFNNTFESECRFARRTAGLLAVAPLTVALGAVALGRRRAGETDERSAATEEPVLHR